MIRSEKQILLTLRGWRFS